MNVVFVHRNYCSFCATIRFWQFLFSFSLESWHIYLIILTNFVLFKEIINHPLLSLIRDGAILKYEVFLEHTASHLFLPHSAFLHVLISKIDSFLFIYHSSILYFTNEQVKHLCSSSAQHSLHKIPAQFFTFHSCYFSSSSDRHFEILAICIFSAHVCFVWYISNVQHFNIQNILPIITYGII